MIKFFRQIRKSLLSEGKTRKYLKYAIGEIALVMIGILLALQVNNWNEQRKLVQKEIQMLIALKGDLEANINNLDKGIKTVRQLHNNNLKIIGFFEKKAPYEKSMSKYFTNFLAYWDPDFSYGSYENLKSQGLDLISNNDLRNSIINQFDVEMDVLDIAEMNRLNILFENMIVPMQMKYFYKDYTSRIPGSLVPFNYDRMIQDMEFYSVCTEMAYRQERSIDRYKAFNIRSAKLIEQIDSELEKLN